MRLKYTLTDNFLEFHEVVTGQAMPWYAEEDKMQIFNLQLII